MANKKISELSSSGALTGAELIETVQGGVNVKTTTQDIANLSPGSAGTQADVTLANGVTAINMAAADIQFLTITEAKVIDSITNSFIGTIGLVIPGTNSVTFTTINAAVTGSYNAGEQNIIWITCIDATGTPEYSIVYENSLSSSGAWGTIPGTLSDQTDLQDALDAKADVGDLASKQDIDSDLTAIAALSPSNDDIIQRKTGAWVNRTIAQLKTDLAVAIGDLANIAAKTLLGNKTTGSAAVTALTRQEVRENFLKRTEYIILEEDFLGGNGWFSQTNGAGAAVSLTAAGVSVGLNHMGNIQLSTGTTATGWCYLRTQSLSAMALGQGEVLFTCVFRTPAALSTGTETYTLEFGISDKNANLFTDGAIVRYRHDLNSGKFQYVASVGSSFDAVDSGVTVVADTWYKVVILINAAGDSTTFTINDANSQTIAEAMTVPGQYGVIAGITKSASAGVATTFLIDFLGVKVELTTAR